MACWGRDSRGAVLVVDPLQLSDVEVPHALQPLQLRLDLRFLLKTHSQSVRSSS